MILTEDDRIGMGLWTESRPGLGDFKLFKGMTDVKPLPGPWGTTVEVIRVKLRNGRSRILVNKVVLTHLAFEADAALRKECAPEKKDLFGPFINSTGENMAFGLYIGSSNTFDMKQLRDRPDSRQFRRTHDSTELSFKSIDMFNPNLGAWLSMYRGLSVRPYIINWFKDKDSPMYGKCVQVVLERSVEQYIRNTIESSDIESVETHYNEVLPCSAAVVGLQLHATLTSR